MYYRLREQVLAALKRQTMCVQGLSEADFCEGSAQGGLPGAYSLRRLRDNLYMPSDSQWLAALLCCGDMPEKMAYLGSSGALLCNLLYICRTRVDDRCTDVCDETAGILARCAPDRLFCRCRLRTLQSKNACTTVDAMLFSETGDACACLDAKLLEWFVYRVNPLRDAFMHCENYAEPASAACFPKAFAALIPYRQADAYEHAGCLQYYDGFFVLRQLLALYHTIREQRRLQEKDVHNGDTHKTKHPDFRKVRRLIYTSVYWRLRHPARLGYAGLKIEAAAERMEQEAALFRNLTVPVARLFRETLDIELQTRLTDIWTFLEQCNAAPAGMAWMQRYEL